MTTPTGRRARLAGAAGAAALIAGAAAVHVATRRWTRDTARAVQRLHARPSDASDAIHAASRDALPAPVARYLAHVLPAGAPAVRRAHLRWRGEFRLAPGAPWRPFRAAQWVTASPPGFVWDAEIRLAPLVTVRVRDGYDDGRGSMHAAAAALVPVVDVQGTPAMAAGALARWLGEAVWVPTALAPGAALRWTAIDDRTARATLVDRGVTASADFHFGAGGEVEAVTGERYRDVGGRGVLTPWRATLGGHARVQGMLVPTTGEVAWLLPEGAFAYWRGRLAAAAYETAAPGTV